MEYLIPKFDNKYDYFQCKKKKKKKKRKKKITFFYYKVCSFIWFQAFLSNIQNLYTIMV